ncbi:MAG: hypothetical protein ACK5XQ_13070 [Flavobacteriales bacterium]|jgi:hypothetical protein
MKTFPNLVFEQGSFDSVYVFYLLIYQFPQSFFRGLLENEMKKLNRAVVEMPKWSDDYFALVEADSNHESIMEEYHSISELTPFLKEITHHAERFKLSLGNNDIQVYNDPHDFDVAIIACRSEYDEIVVDFLKTYELNDHQSLYDVRLVDLKDFERVFEYAESWLRDYGLKQVKAHYLPKLR